MNIIKRKADVAALLKGFDQLAEFDQLGQKHYFVFEDTEKDGQCTVMKYGNASFSIHCKGASYCDSDEVFLEFDELIDLLWKRRKAVNAVLRDALKEKVS
ncbi:hypothetical protein [Bacillus sp. RAR_GA_16]|uniref:hypothetical protein n=1 Tax=Bacillus sp. RAR_GA_16 TaxID=2876774 RepID=UPI001CC93300|nr:hypothetical protein [Bacillus sp. RAR_GA_16]MCA0172523.1 hypothetical protein [Bacillus sp. RAR_GA_16]